MLDIKILSLEGLSTIVKGLSYRILDLKEPKKYKDVVSQAWMSEDSLIKLRDDQSHYVDIQNSSSSPCQRSHA